MALFFLYSHRAHLFNKDVIEGHDPQLEKAVEEGLRLIKENPVNLLPEPAPPVRVLRPKK